MGGPMKDQFGRFIQDRELISPTNWPSSHVRYWQGADDAALKVLQGALRLKAFPPN
jgi:hypothetical protein